MTATKAAATEVTKAPTKMDRARVLFKEIYAKGYKYTIEKANSQRAEFIGRAKAEFGMTQHGAATYFQNLSNEAKGEPTYKYSAKKKGTTGTEANAATTQLNNTTAEGTKGLQEDLNKSNPEGEIGKFRWMLTNAEGEELASYPTRSKAQTEAKAQNLEWADRNAKAE